MSPDVDKHHDIYKKIFIIFPYEPASPVGITNELNNDSFIHFLKSHLPHAESTVYPRLYNPFIHVCVWLIQMDYYISETRL